MELITVLGEVDFSLNKIVFWHQNQLNFKKMNTVAMFTVGFYTY